MIYKLKNKFVRFSTSAIHIILKTDNFDEFSENIVYYINESPIQNIKSALTMSLDNIASFKKILNIGLSMDLINNELALNIIKSATKDKKLTIMVEFANCGLNIFENQDNVITYFLENFHDPNAIKYLVDKIISFDTNLDLSTLLLKYINLKPNYYWGNGNSTYFCYKLYNIFINYDTLKKLNCNFFVGFDILSIILNDLVTLNTSSYSPIIFDYNTILLFTKFFDLLIQEKVIHADTIIKKTSVKIEHFKKKTFHGGAQEYQYEILQTYLYLLKYLENKGIKSDEFIELKNIVIPPVRAINIQNNLPKKLKAIKWKY